MVFTPNLAVILVCFPAAYELDFGTVVKVAPPYEYTITLRFREEPDLKIPCFYNGEYSAADLVDNLLESLRDPRWKFKKNAGKLVIYGYDDVPIQMVTVIGGKRPAVSRVPYFPKEKK